MARTEEQEKEIFALKEVSEKNDRLVVQLERDLANAVQDLGRTGELSTSIETTPIQNSDTSLLPILSSQRHRLHERVTNLEQTVSCEKAKNLSLESEIEKVRAENIKMVERIRFLQSTDQKSYNVEVGYLNEFGNSKKMTAHDKVTLNIGKTILASPRSRSVFFSYLLILHVLIMLVLYNFAFNQSVMRDAETECEYKFHQHMLDKHGH
uniref:CASP C-terminal domain-containing protein n=1 Tax=Caenorhabditis japonica TaxID=281687 RepID=A0A8R1HWI9_CAEJA